MAYSSLDNVQAFLGFPGGSASKESACNAGDLGSIPGLGRAAGEENSYPLQYSGLENSKECIVHGVTKSQTRLSNFHYKAQLAWTVLEVLSEEYNFKIIDKLFLIVLGKKMDFLKKVM